ncbi:16S rRNA (guanine1207-N2)-methyltransferase [Enhydrobacter aerosaccus]|uniref:16S rRNA (Guanine1207-N2)-methyltransferase n=1 Tax=Enhydrobacter aerosaccus TaxID=225324 RepID=A0A1T4KF10_9HYPH|nr:class I SAM-dependent methyltransferase [Enhydrobacter aerosaccus]SJZ41048.1 16S rRNA (guanine1207-N2)-methyltransferase [Enhydrobacter aerosaccus]
MSQAGRALAHAFELGALQPKRAFFLRAEMPTPIGADCEQSFRPEFLRLERAGRSVVPRLDDGTYPLGLVLLTKHKEENFANIARGWSLLEPRGTLVCAGANEDGAASLEKQVGKAFGLVDMLSKFHCRVFWLVRTDREPPDYWRALTQLQPVGDGNWLSQPGIFSWDRIDDGSALLVRCLPNDLAGHVADFGCGWGYLTRHVLQSCADVAQIDLIDAECRAIEAARANVADKRARFHWLDLTTEAAPTAYDVIVCNPPFHTGRASTPSLGQQVIQAASRALKPGGHFYMVANRGLPYEPLLKAHFTSFETLADNNKFKVSRAVR